MFKGIFILFSIFISTCLYSQTLDAIQTKSFFYDEDNYSLTQESIQILEEFIIEIKTHPIEIIEIIGYIEKTGKDIDNKIRSKRRMSKLKDAIDSVIILHQYKPENKNYPPFILNTFSDEYNWRRVDVLFKFRPKIDKLTYSKETNLTTLEKPIKTIEESKLENKVDPIIKNKSTIDSTFLVNKKINTEAELKSIELEKMKSITITLDTSQTDLNLELKPQETGKISTEGKTQTEIDHLVIREKSEKTNGNRSTAHPDVGSRLAKINVNEMDNSVILINLNLQFEGDAPLITRSSVNEINELVKFLHNNNSIDAFIRGHVCCGDQMSLSSKRAKTVYLELICRGINPNRLRYEGFSNTIPAVFPERTDLDRSRNRRVDIIFSKSTRSNTPVDLIPNKEFADSLQFIEKSIIIDKNEIAYLDIKNKTQEEIDNIIINEVSSILKKYPKKIPKTTEEKLANIDISSLKTTVSLIVLGLQFNNTDPILDETTIKEMDDLFNFLNQNKQIHAFIRGHVCCGDNMKLSKKRAKYVYNEMIKRGIEKERLRYQGFSNTLLLVNPERTELDRDKNKRVDVIFSIK